jgi:hypothetical protein
MDLGLLAQMPSKHDYGIETIYEMEEKRLRKAYQGGV